MPFNITNLPAALASIVQTGILEREFEEGLDSNLAYRREALREVVPNNIGETITRTRTGRKTPVTTPIGPVTFSNLDNGMSPADATTEQYTFIMGDYGDTADVDLMANQVVIASNTIRVARNNGVQAGQSLERICRGKLFGAYLGGQTYVRTDLGASSTTTAHVDDIRGFTTVLVNGVVTPISGAATLSVAETSVSSGVNQTLTVTGAAADGTNHSQTPGGISGVLTFTAATSPVNGDSLAANNAPTIIRPSGHLTTPQMTNADIFTLDLALEAKTRLELNGVPPCEDGTYHLIYDAASERHLFADQKFMVLFAGRDQSKEYQNGGVFSLLGITFIKTNETLIQLPSTQQPAAGTPTGASVVTPTVRRPIMVGAEAIIEGDFEGLEYWLNQQDVNTIASVTLVNGVAHIFRPPLDRMQRQFSLTWDWIGDFAVPSDQTATTSIIPTASNALFKRCVVLEHAG